MARTKLHARNGGPGVRPEILASWERCEKWELNPQSTTARQRRDPISARDQRLIGAAQPVLDQLEQLLHKSKTAAIITDKAVNVLDWRCSDSGYSQIMNSWHGGPGYSWAEEQTGTTAVALAVELGREFEVVGNEHYAADVSSCAAAATPIFDPLTRELIGAINLSCSVENWSHHMLPAVAQAAQAIEQRLFEAAGEDDQLRIARFLEETREEGSDAVFLVNGKLLLSNERGSRMLGSFDRSQLWTSAKEALSGRHSDSAEAELTLLDGRGLAASFESIDPASAGVGALVRISESSPEPQPKRRRQEPKRRPQPGLEFGPELDDEALTRAGQEDRVLIVGPAGTGKQTLAEEVHRHSGRRGLVVFEAALDSDWESPDTIRNALTGPWERELTLMISHVDCLSSRSLAILSKILDGPQAGPLIATMSVAPGALENPRIAALFEHKLYLPPLNQRLAELPQMVTAVMRRYGATGQMQPAAIDALARHDWPGNLSELDCVVAEVVAHRKTCDITLRDLPAQLVESDGGGRRLTRMEQLERAAIERALAEANGNRSMAAEILEIGRATLYRKLKSYELAAPAPGQVSPHSPGPPFE